MSVRDDLMSVLIGLPASTLSQLGAALREGTLRHGFSVQTLFPLVGEAADIVDRTFCALISGGLDQHNLGLLCLGLGRALSERDAAERNIQLVLSGPEVQGTPVTDTKTTVLSLFEEATKEVLISSYVFHEAADLFRTLAAKFSTDEHFKVTFIADLSHLHRSPDKPLSLIESGFAAEFKRKHWSGRRMPAIWHDPRFFDGSKGNIGVLHAKIIVVDRRTAFVTSANFTEAGQSRNIEVGVLIRHAHTAERLANYFDGLISTGALRKCEII